MKHSGQVQRHTARRSVAPRSWMAAVVIVGSVSLGFGSVAQARERTLCVGAGAGCVPTLQAALDASHDGDVIRVGRGTFAGGVRITTSVTLRGAGAAFTRISGGGPVMEIGTFGAVTEPTVSIDGVTISDGVTTTTDDPDFPQAIALGGGIMIPWAHDHTIGATVTISNSVISNNRVDPATNIPGDPPFKHFGSADGAGIVSFGALTLVSDRVSGNSVNTAGSVNANEAQGGGVAAAGGSLTMNNTQVLSNRVIGTAVGLTSDSGGILVVFSASLTMSGGRISDNVVSIDSDYPPEVDTVAFAGGLSVGEGRSATLDHVTISNNTVSAATVNGTTLGFGGAITTDTNSYLTLSDSVINGNHVTATADQPPDLVYSAAAASGGLDLFGSATITRTAITNNTANVTSHTGTVLAIGGGMTSGSPPDQPITITDSVFHANAVTATSTSGSAIAAGGAIANMGTLSLTRALITANTASAAAPNAIARGGGISNASFPDDPNATISLTLTDVLIAANRLDAGSSGTADGGGLYTQTPVTVTRTRIIANTPNQCTGCS